MIDVFGEELFQGKGHGAGELDAAARGQLGLSHEHLGCRGERHDLPAARDRRRQGQGPPLPQGLGQARVVDHEPFGLFLAGRGKAEQ